MNGVSILASFGALLWIFHDGNLSAPLGFLPLGFVDTTLPVILFCILFGLSMGYEVFLLSPDEGGVRPHRLQTRRLSAPGLERSGRIVTKRCADRRSPAAGSFAFAEVVLIKAIGLGVAIAVALDAHARCGRSWCLRRMRACSATGSRGDAGPLAALDRWTRLPRSSRAPRPPRSSSWRRLRLWPAGSRPPAGCSAGGGVLANPTVGTSPAVPTASPVPWRAAAG